MEQGAPSPSHVDKPSRPLPAPALLQSWSCPVSPVQEQGPGRLCGHAGSSASSLPCRLARAGLHAGQSPEGPGALGQAASAHLPPSAQFVTWAQRVALPSDLTAGPPQKQADKQGSRAAVPVWFSSPANSFWFHPSIFHDNQQEPEVRGQVRELFHLNLMKLCHPQALPQ